MDTRFAIFLKTVVKSFNLKTPENIFVLGCGSNNENISIKKIVNPQCFVVGVDINILSIQKNHSTNNLVVMDGSCLGIKDSSFDCAYSYHALEHIQDYHSALKEIRRILTPNGYFLLGVPNKSRLFGYIGSNTSLWHKIKWNMNDYSMRIKGEFENKFGAHAGFEQNELKTCLDNYFDRTLDVTREYFYCRYKSKRPFLDMIIASGLQKKLFPAIYYLCFKN